ncbi:hypothetical protein B566_EDAN016213, partial [Ephemera danica]
MRQHQFNLQKQRSNIAMIPRNYQHYAPSLVGPNGKRIIFVAPLVELVEQQAKVIHKYSTFEVGYFLGNMNVDDWTDDIWRKKLAEHQVLVMTAQILLNCLNEGFIKMDRICLLVIDECHHATEKHPMNMIMNHYKANCGTRIVGLTAILVKGNIGLHQIDREVATLEQNLCSKIVQLNCIDELK